MKTIRTIDFFKDNLWNELDRFDSNGKFIESVTCTDENLDNLYNSQFINDTVYGVETFSYYVSI